MAIKIDVHVLILCFNLFWLVFAIEAACFERERLALVQFKQGLQDPSARLSSWTGDDCCKWRGVTCDPQTGNVIRLDLRNPYNLTYPEYIMSDSEAVSFNFSSLSGHIHPSLAHLQYLQYLDLSVNNFQGIQIPDFIGSFKELKYLNLSHAAFVGTLPSSLGNLSNLVVKY